MFLPCINHPCRQCPWRRTRSETAPKFGQSMGWGGLHCLILPGTSPERMNIQGRSCLLHSKWIHPLYLPLPASCTPGALNGHLGLTQLLLFGVASHKNNNWVERSLLTSPSHNVTFAKDRDSDKGLIVYYLWLLEVSFVSLRVLLISWMFTCTI